MSHAGTHGRADAALEQLRARGARVTKPRRAVLDVLEATRPDEHLNADEIAARAAEAAPGLHRATVYRALSTLGDLGIVAHTHVAESAAVYHLAAPHQEGTAHHGHLQCTACGVVLDVPAELLDPLAQKLRRDLDFELSPEHAALLGICASCRDAG